MRHLVLCLLLALFTIPAWAQVDDEIAVSQLDQVFGGLFDTILDEGFQTSPGNHGQHFLGAAAEASGVLTPALNSLIASNIASFPLSSTVAGVTFDFSGGAPTRQTDSYGPIFAETGQTLGAGKLVVGFNASYLSLDRMRGMRMDQLNFNFLHSDVEAPGLGDSSNEYDIVQVNMDVDVNASIFALYASYGVARNFDVSLAIPFVDIGMDVTADAQVESFTLGAEGEANHRFGEDGSGNPVLQRTVRSATGASGIGDLALRFKYGVPLSNGLYGAALLDLRLPTGEESDFLGTGSASARLVFIGSGRIGDFAPHINLGYDYRGADLDSDEIEAVIGFDQKVTEAVTFAFDLLGEFDIDTGEAVALLPGETTIGGTRTVEHSNIPDQDYDHMLNASAGFRIAPNERFQFLVNVLVPMLNNGLTSSVMPTAGLSLTF